MSYSKEPLTQEPLTQEPLTQEPSAPPLVQETHRCYDNPDDWDECVHDIYNSRINWALLISIVGALIFWPLCLLSCFLISDIRRETPIWHRHYCKVRMVYWVSFFGVFLGIFEWFLVVILASQK